MARSDLLVSLVRAGAAGDSRELATTVEAPDLLSDSLDRLGIH